MDNFKNNKLNINALLKMASENAKSSDINKNGDIDDFIDKNLSDSQAQTVREFLKDEEKTKALLNSDAAKELFGKFFGGKNNG